MKKAASNEAADVTERSPHFHAIETRFNAPGFMR